MTRKVAASTRKAVIELTAAYQQFNEQRRELTALHQQLHAGLDDYEKAVVRQSAKPMGLLPAKASLSAKSPSPLQPRQPGEDQSRRKSFKP